MDFNYEPISPASQAEYPLTIVKLEEISDKYPLRKQEEFYPELYSVCMNNTKLAPVSNFKTQTPPFCPKQQTSNYTEDSFDLSEFLKFSSSSNSGINVKESFEGPGPIRTKQTRTSYTRHQVGILERAFEINPYLTAPRRIQLSKDLKLGESQIKVWFQNRRCRAKKRDREEEGSAADNILPLDILPLAASPTSPTTIQTTVTPGFMPLPGLPCPSTTIIQQIPPTQAQILVNLPLTPLPTPTTTPVATPTTTPLATPPSGTECSELEEIMDFILESTDEVCARHESIEEIQLDLEISAHIFLLSSEKNVKLN